MDHDLIAASLGVLGLANLASAAGYCLGNVLKPRWRLFLLAIALVGASFYAAFVVGRLDLIGIFPSENVILKSNATPIFILFATGLAWTIPTQDSVSRRARFVAMASLSILFFFSPLLRSRLRPITSDEEARFTHGVCLQSHWATCAPAAAATLLHLHGISVTEKEMVTTCLTSEDGTEPLGLYRGLRVGTQGRAVRPMLASKDSTKWGSLEQFPVIALVSFRDDEAIPQASYRRAMGAQGEGHAIVVFGRRQNGDYLIGDPAFGRTVWDQESFRRRFRGDAIFLSSR